MGNKTRTTIYLLATIAFVLFVFSVTAAESGILVVPQVGVDQHVYIVQLVGEPLATYQGDLNGFKATSPIALGTDKLNMHRTASVSYLNYLAEQRAKFLDMAESILNRQVETIYEYDVVYNGLALVLTEAEAEALTHVPGVAQVQQDIWYHPQTDVTPDFIGATKIWDGSAVNGSGTKGEGIIVGVIDTGIWPEHPSFADDGSYQAPENWNGGCSTPKDNSQPYTCNNKLIGAKHFLTGYSLGAGGYDGLFYSARDDNGHGTHTASTAAGNEGIPVTLLGVDRGLISGIAPRAYVAAYKGLGPQGGTSSDLVAAINAAVSDGVDVINYSIGGGATNPWNDPTAIAFRSARSAGVFVATSAGNSGPDEQTVGSPGNAPWITTVGASTSNRHFISDITLQGPGTPPVGLFGASVTKGVQNFNLVDAEGIADVTGDKSGLCLNPFPAGTFEANDVVLCQRGQIARVLRGTYVKAGGGGGVILYNPEQQGLATDNYVIPAVHVENDIGLLIKDYLTTHSGQVMVTFTTGQKIYDSDARVTADMMASFSSRGPNATVLDIIKPDVTAPGVQILAGASPEHTDPGAQDELFQAIQGTSMSSPHVAGAAALIKAVHPDWSPAEIESALMTTANTTHVKEDGSTPADPFDMGAGRIDLNYAAKAPLVMDESAQNYIAANPNLGGDPKELNTPSLGNSNCVNSCIWIRTFRNASGETLSWDTSLNQFAGSISPAKFTLEANQSISLTIAVSAADLPTGLWAFGSAEIVPDLDGQNKDLWPSTHLPIAIIPDHTIETEQITFATRRNAGSYLISELPVGEANDLTIESSGLVPGEITAISLAQDPSPGNPFDNLFDVWWGIFSIPNGSTRFVNEIQGSDAKNVDLFVGLDNNGNGRPDESEKICSAVSGAWDEYCNVDLPQKGNWWVLVQNRSGSGEAIDDAIYLSTAIVPNINQDNMTITPISSIPAENTIDVRIEYDLGAASAGQNWYGAFSIGTDAQNPGNVAKDNVDLRRIEDDVVKWANIITASPGDNIAYTIMVEPNVSIEEVAYQIVDQIPEGLTLIEESVQATAGSISVTGGEIKWSGILSGVDFSSPRTRFSGDLSNDPVSIHYEVLVNQNTQPGQFLINRAESTTNQVGSKKETAEAQVFIGYLSFFPSILTNNNP